MSQNRRIWVDADACPRPMRDIIIKAAQRVKITTTFVANHNLGIPRSEWVSAVQVSSGFDVADDYIVEQCQPGDLVISNDIPLADEVISKGAKVINLRGETLSAANIKSRLNMRDFMETMRSSGEHTGGPPPLSARDRMIFGNALDRFLAHLT